MKYCPKCKTDKSQEEFSKQQARKGGLQWMCKQCARIIDKHRSPEQRMKHTARSRKWKKKNPDKVQRSLRRSRLKREYGLTETSFAAMLFSQNNKCAICAHELASRPHIDHCHVTRKVRGILCGPCNHGLGSFRDSETALFSAIEYLRKNK